MKAGGFISLHRQILDWEWFHDAITFHTFVYLLLSANFEPASYKGIEVQRGQLVTSLTVISKDLQQTIQQTRTALKHLKLTGEITDEGTPQYRIITIVKYDEYQRANRPSNRQLTGNQQTNQQTNQQQYNNINNINNNNKTSLTGCNNKNNNNNDSSKRFVKPTLDEVRQYCLHRKNWVDWNEFYSFYEANGWKVGRNPMKDWKAAVRYWEPGAKEEATRKGLTGG